MFGAERRHALGPVDEARQVAPIEVLAEAAQNVGREVRALGGHVYHGHAVRRGGLAQVPFLLARQEPGHHDRGRFGVRLERLALESEQRKSAGDGLLAVGVVDLQNLAGSQRDDQVGQTEARHVPASRDAEPRFAERPFGVGLGPSR